MHFMKEAQIVEKDKAMIQVGKKAPDFAAPGYLDGKVMVHPANEYLKV